ncbi:MAG TPA: NADH-quinone oxidoreductase subunit N [Gemmatimonadaceae bacterium]|nr:NADH-quinone oxidoreductase subunit N [Gemmatimonadaceae bacterium]
MAFDLSQSMQLIAALTPDIIMMVGGMVLMLVSAWGTESVERQRRVGTAAIGVCIVSAVFVVYFMAVHATAGAGVIAVDNFRWIVDLVLLAATAGTIGLGLDYNTREGILPAESHVLVIFATSGMMILAAARDLTIVFLGIELMSIAVYILTGMNRRSEKSAEGAIKYFLLGAFSTGFLLYGIALVYGATGTTSLTLIGERVTAHQIMSAPMLLTGIGLMLIGFGFKVALAPFHMWAPDVYEGAPTPITAYMAAAVKAAAFAAFLRVFLEAFAGEIPSWHVAVWWLAAITMVVGNLIALASKDIKRLLAYSSIAHAGYILVVLASGQALGSSAFLFYIVAYTLATFGAFGVVVALGQSGEPYLNVDDYAGLWTVRPWLSVSMAVCMLSLLGFPIFGGAGFFAKWYVIQSALYAPEPQTRLAVLLVLTSVVSAGYYMYVVLVMFMKPRREVNTVSDPRSVGSATRWVIGLSTVILLVLGVYPNALVSLTQGKGSYLRAPTPQVSQVVPR